MEKQTCFEEDIIERTSEKYDVIKENEKFNE